MAHVISVATLKGGVGKTTISMNLGTCFHQMRLRVLLVDANPEQNSLSQWAACAEQNGHDVPAVVGIDGKRLRKELEKVGAGFDVVIVDSAPAGADARAAMVCADLVIMPVTPGAQEVWTLDKTLAVLEEAQALRPEIKARLLFNNAERTQLSTKAQQTLEGESVPLLAAVLRHRVTFGEAMASGQGVVTYEPQSDAAAEVRRMAKEVFGVLRD